MNDREPQSLHSEEVASKAPVDTQVDQLVQPRHEHPGAVFTESKDLGRFGVDRVSEVLSVEPILNQPDVLPAHLI